jgi:hypothetical protein
MKPRTLVAGFSSLCWLGLAVWWTFYWPTLAWALPSNMAPNAWGDWAGGTFAPLAFLWLVVGYFQQGEELRLQAEELRASVKQQTTLARTAARQTHLLEKSQTISLRAQIMEHQPRFLGFVPWNPVVETGNMEITIQNVGRPCFSATVTATENPEPTQSMGQQAQPTWLNMHEGRFTVNFGQLTFPTERFLNITYRDELMVVQRQRWKVKMTDTPAHGFHLVVELDDHTFNLPPLLLAPTDGSIEERTLG